MWIISEEGVAVNLAQVVSITHRNGTRASNAPCRIIMARPVSANDSDIILGGVETAEQANRIIVRLLEWDGQSPVHFSILKD